ncbi:MAG: ABC transporter ATP-binding protein [Chloroflexi bacterium]|nr:ABC transporter ATP-binding protein [Chloroflexota bacterium]
MEEGDSWAVIGPSGCGKTTLLYLLAGLRLPQEGTVEARDAPVRGPRRETGLILQDHGLLPWATARQNIQLGLRIRGLSARESARLADTWLARLGLAGLTDRYPGQLSGGQRQRVAIARTLALEPDLLLMDEPFSSLDALTREGFQSLALELGVARGLSTVLVTHDIQEAVFLGRWIMVLAGGPGGGPLIIRNPGAGDPAYRAQPEYQRIAQEVRGRVLASSPASP